MNNSLFLEGFLKEKRIEYKKDQSLSAFSTFKIGGNAKYIATPNEPEQLSELLTALKENGERSLVIGNGSNILFDDSGFDGVIVATSKMNRTEVSGTTLTALCGAPITKTSLLAAKCSLSGLEFAYGIPGTVGGGVYMNAGAYGGELSNVITSVDCYDTNAGCVKTLASDECGFSYRKSIFSENGGLIVIGATMRLDYGDENEIRETMRNHMKSRCDKQPLEYPSAGSVFKRPEGHFAGKLIEDSGLKGYRIGGAAVSEKHAGFIINLGDATSKDVLLLIEHIQNTVLKNYGIELECEVKHIK